MKKIISHFYIETSVKARSNPSSSKIWDRRANGLSEKDVKAEALKGNAATDALRNKKVDAIFVVAGYPTGAIVELASSVPIKFSLLAFS